MRKFIGCLTIFLIVALCGSLILNLIQLGSSAQLEIPKFEETLLAGDHKSEDKIAVIDLYGVISYSTPGDVYNTAIDDFVGKLRQVREDQSIKAVVIRVDSPGGEVTASDVLYHHVAETNAKKPVVIYMESVAASGAYYTAMGAEYVMANELSITASIGVIMQAPNFQNLADKVGISMITFKSGELKDLLNPLRPVTEKEKALVQNLINETYDKFVGIVARERNLDEAKLRAGVADGRIISGKEAVKDGLIDGTGYFEDAVAKAIELGRADKKAAVVNLDAPYTFSRIFRILGESQAAEKRVSVQIGPKQLELQTGKLYYISSHLF